MDEEVNRVEFDLDVNGIRMRVECFGSGSPLILLHGLGGPLSWGRVPEILSGTHRVVVIHFAGFGLSAGGRPHRSASDHARNVMDALDLLGIHRAAIIGISFGSIVAALCAAQIPKRVESLVLINAVGFRPVNSLIASRDIWGILGFLLRLTVMRSEHLMCYLSSRSFYDVSKRPSDLCREFYTQLSGSGRREAWLDGFGEVLRANLTELLEEIHLPIIMIWGEFDRSVRQGYQEMISSRFSSIRQEIIPKSAHSLPLERPDEVCRSILNFVDGAGRS